MWCRIDVLIYHLSTPLPPSLLPFSPSTSHCQGDTLENVSKELDCIITTGFYFFQTSNSIPELTLEYSPSRSHQSSQSLPLPLSQPSNHVVLHQESQSGPEAEVNIQRSEQWNSEQIDDFVRKLGFLDTEKEDGDKIRHFLHINEVGSLCVNLDCDYIRKLSDSRFTRSYNNILLCSTNRQHTNCWISLYI